MNTAIKKKLISIVVPVFNEEENIEPLYRAVTSVMAKQSDRYEYEFVFTDNHSSDQTFQRLEKLAVEDKRVRAIRFTRNFGYQRSIYMGYMKTRGDAAIQLDCDLQDPPELIPEFIQQWEAGYQVVYGIRRGRKEGWLITKIRKIFYRLIDLISEDGLPHDAGDFRLLDRQVLDELRRIEDYQPYLRGTIAALGFKQTGIPYDREARKRGKSKFSFRQYIHLALDGILNHSVVPLRMATYIGLALSVITVIILVVYAVGRFTFGKDWPAGFTTTTSLILLSISLNAIFLGIIGEYLGRIYKQVKKKPLTRVEHETDSTSSTSGNETK